MMGRADGVDATGAGLADATIGARGAIGGGGTASAAARAAAAAAPAAPVRTATTAPTGATAPAATRISAITPADVAGTSIDTLSVSISNRLSPGLTVSPIDL